MSTQRPDCSACVYRDEEGTHSATGSVVLRTRCQHYDKEARRVVCEVPLPWAHPFPQLRKAADKARNARPWCGDHCRGCTPTPSSERLQMKHVMLVWRYIYIYKYKYQISRGSVVLRTRCQLNDQTARRVSTEMKKVLIRRQARLSCGLGVNSTTGLLGVCLQR